MRLVFKFGGASVKNADAVRNVAEILKNRTPSQVLVIVSAMDKTTNALEDLLLTALTEKTEIAPKLDAIKRSHFEIVNELFNHSIPKNLQLELNLLFTSLHEIAQAANSRQPDYFYDKLVPYGELLSTTIISHYLNETGIVNKWINATTVVKTDYSYRKAKVDWNKTSAQIKTEIEPYFEGGLNGVVISQGFIGGADSLHTTTLGREGSDYSAAIFAYALDADAVSIWKDVPGVLNADPRKHDKTQLLPHISYKEAIELAYYGASVIHPKTIQPLQNKQIPLYVKSFLNPLNAGTLIDADSTHDADIPAYIIKHNQRLISLATRDFSFIAEEHLSHIFKVFNHHAVTMNLMQNSAINFSVAVDENEEKLADLIDELSRDYEVRYNVNLDLLTVRHFNASIVEELAHNKERIVEQRTRNTLRLLLK